VESNGANAERLLNAGWSGPNEILAGRLVTLQPRSQILVSQDSSRVNVAGVIVSLA